MPTEKPIRRAFIQLPPSVAMGLAWMVPVAAYAVSRVLDNSMRRPSVTAFVGHVLRLF